MGGRMGGWGQAGSPDVWVFARREDEGGEGLRAQGDRAPAVQSARF